MPRPEQYTTITPGVIVPTQRTPELVATQHPSSLSFTNLSSVHSPGYDRYDIAAFDIDQALLNEVADELGGPNAGLLEPADDNRIALEHHTYSANRAELPALLRERPAARELLDLVARFARTKMAPHRAFGTRDGLHAGLAAWEATDIRLDRYRIASVERGGSAAVKSFSPTSYVYGGETSRVLSARLTLEGQHQLELNPAGTGIEYSIHLDPRKVLLSREVGLLAHNGPVHGPGMRLHAPTNHLSLTVSHR